MIRFLIASGVLPSDLARPGHLDAHARVEPGAASTVIFSTSPLEKVVARSTANIVGAFTTVQLVRTLAPKHFVWRVAFFAIERADVVSPAPSFDVVRPVAPDDHIVVRG